MANPRVVCEICGLLGYYAAEAWNQAESSFIAQNLLHIKLTAPNNNAFSTNITHFFYHIAQSLTYLPAYSCPCKHDTGLDCGSDINIIQSGHLKPLILSDLENQLINFSLH
jgi:hypothetical protein